MLGLEHKEPQNSRINHLGPHILPLAGFGLRVYGDGSRAEGKRFRV